MTARLLSNAGSTLAMPSPDAADLGQLVGWLDACQQRERDGLAAALHDQLGSSLTALAMRLAMIARQNAAEPQLATQWDKANAQLSASSATVRRVQKQLRPVALEALGLQPALADHLMQFGLRVGVVCNLQFEAKGAALSLADAAVLFRIIEAALANVESHARARNVTLTVENHAPDSTRGWEITLVDDGVGFDAAGTVLRATQGLRLMQVRANSVGMKLTINSAPEQGCRVALQGVPPRLL
jgi:signal transduction histidine kinase